MSQNQNSLLNLSPKQRALYELLLNERKATPRSGAIQPRPGAEWNELSFAQQRLWFLDQYEPSSSAYNVVSAYRLKGPLDLDVLERSLQELVVRHEGLRAIFQDFNGKPMHQINSPSSAVLLTIVDASSWPVQDRASEAVKLATQEAQKPFDLAVGPLFRPFLFCLGVQDHLLMLCIHHIVSDGWSMGILFRELEAVYTAYSRGEASPLSKLPLQYADFAPWQRERLSGQFLEEQLLHWRKHLEGAPQLLELPADHPRPAVRNHAGAHHFVELSPELSTQLEEVGRQHGATLFMVLLAAFKVLLWRISRQEDLVVGSAMAGRNRTDLEPLVGFFINMQPLRTNLSGNPTFGELVERVREVTLGAYAHQDVPFEKLVEEFQAQRDLSSTPIFQVVFALHNAPNLEFNLPGIQSEHVRIETGSAKFDLAVEVSPTSQGLLCAFEYSTELFEEPTIRRWGLHFQTLLESITADTSRRIGELELLSQTERRQILVDWNNTYLDHPRSVCMHTLFEACAEETPSALCVAHADRQLGYDELNRQANQVAHYLETLGTSANSVVAICAERSALNVIGLLGIWKAGGAYLPIDPSYPRERIAFMLEDAGVKVIATQEKFLSKLPIHIRKVVLDKDQDTISRFPHTNPSASVMADNLAYVIYTSGSTGKPKGVEVGHRSLLNLVTWHQRTYGLQREDRATQLAGPAFDASVWELWPYLGAGASIHIPDDDTRDSATALWQWMATNAITISFVPTPLAEAMLDSEIPLNLSLRYLLTGGDRLHPVKRSSLPFTLVNHYGPTENTVVATCSTVTPGATEPPAIGRSIANTQVYLLDSYRQPVPIGITGELFIGGEGLAKGYRNRPELTEERFIPNPFRSEPSSRLYKTGDLARYRPNGELEFVGRIDNQVKIRGFRIELGEVEGVLASHPDVRDCVVVAGQDNESEKRLVAYVSGHKGKVISAKDLQNHLGQQLPSYMVPTSFVIMDQLPLTPNGKIDRTALPKPQSEAPTNSLGYVAARGKTEQILAEIWGEVLRRDRIGIHDNFFELGGDSILSIQVIAKASRAGLKITPKQIFQQQTIAELALIASSKQKESSHPERIVGTAPLTPIQHWFFEQKLDKPKHFNQQMLLSLAQRVDAGVLNRTLAAIVEHHDALRLQFDLKGGGWHQRHTDDRPPIQVETVDLSQLPEAKHQRAIGAASEQAHGTLDSTKGPIMRVLLFERGERHPQQLLWVIHHLVVDGVSWRILLEDLETAYAQIAAAREVGLPPKTTSYQRWAEMVVEHARSREVRNELQYWLEMLENKPAHVPVDLPGGENTLASARTIEISLGREETSALLYEAASAYRTQTSEILLTAVVQAFAAWTGFNSVLLAMEGHGREDILRDVDVSRSVGWFTSMYPIQLRCRRVADPGESLKAIKEQLRNLPNHGIGYGLLRYLNADTSVVRRLRGIPKPQVSFNYLGQFDQVLSESKMFSLARHDSGRLRGLEGSQSADGNRAYLIDIDGHVIDARLTMRWTYSENLHYRETIELLAQRFRESLRLLIAHCQAVGSAAFTASDFAVAHMSHRDLRKLAGGIGQSPKGSK